MITKIKFRELLSSKHQFEPGESHLVFRFRLLNYFLIIGVFFGLLIGFLGDKGLMKIGEIQPVADYLFAFFNIVLIWYFRQKKTNFSLVAWLFVISTLLLFIVALISVNTDEARIVWFYITVYLSYMLLGVRSGLVFTALCILCIVIPGLFIDLHISATAISTYVIALIILSLLSRAHALHVSEYERKLKEQNLLLEKNIQTMNHSLYEAESANKVKSLFLANMSHEIRTPMNGVLSMIDVLDKTHLSGQQKLYLNAIQRSGQSLQLLIDDLLDLSKIESGTFELHPVAFNSSEMIDEILEQVAVFFEESSASLKTDIQSDIPDALFADVVRLKQVIVNLLSNAAKFTPDGEVELRVSGPCSDSVCKLTFEVKDNGVGIPADKQQTIFEVFQQLSTDRIANKGVGLGLTICNKIIKKMQGKITLVSEEGKGSCFTVEVNLPVVKEKIQEKSSTKHVAASDLKILVVEDDAISRVAIKTLLSPQSREVVVVENAQKAINILSDVAAGFCFDVILMDLNLPMISGIEASQIIKDKQLSDALIVGMTASAMAGEKDACLAAGMVAVIEKPVCFEALIKVTSSL